MFFPWQIEDAQTGSVCRQACSWLAGIKLCTGRILTNHPHYEDQALREDQTGKSLRLVWLESQFNPNLNMSRTSRSPGTQKLTCGNVFVKVTYGIVTYQVWWPIHRISALLLTHPKWTHTAVNTHTHTHTYTHTHTHTHTVNTLPEQWAAIYAAASGEQLGATFGLRVHSLTIRPRLPDCLLGVNNKCCKQH